jgi:hypothetical protein
MNSAQPVQSTQGEEGKKEGEQPVRMPLIALVRAVMWTRSGNKDAFLRITGDGAILLKGHVDEKVEVTILRRDGGPLVIFNGRISRFRSQGHDYVVIHFPKRLTPMLPLITKETDDDALMLQVALSGIKVKPRRKVVKEVRKV